MPTLLTDFLIPMRFLLADRDASVQMFQDPTITNGVMAGVQMYQYPGWMMTPDNTGIIGVDGGELSDFPNMFGLICFKTTRLFMMSEADGYSQRTRAFSERVQGYKMFMAQLEQHINELENGEMFSAWQNFYGFLGGISGMSLLEVYTAMTVRSPFYAVTLTASGSTAAG